MEFPDLSGDDIEWLQEAFIKTVLERRQEDRENRKIPKEDKGKVSLGGGRLVQRKHPLNLDFDLHMKKKCVTIRYAWITA